MLIITISFYLSNKGLLLHPLYRGEGQKISAVIRGLFIKAINSKFSLQGVVVLASSKPSNLNGCRWPNT